YSPIRCFLLFQVYLPLQSTLFHYTTLFRSCANFLAPFFGRGEIMEGIEYLRNKLEHYRHGALKRQKIYDMKDESMLRVCSVLARSEEHTSELQSRENLVCRLLLEQKNI